MRTRTIVAVTAAFMTTLLLSCDDDPSSTRTAGSSATYEDVMQAAEGYLLQAAIETFFENNVVGPGPPWYPDDIHRRAYPYGKSVVGYLGGQLPNVVTGDVLSEPSSDPAPGALVYETIENEFGLATGYAITAYGRNGRERFTLSTDPLRHSPPELIADPADSGAEPRDIVSWNCYIIARAIDLLAARAGNGIYREYPVAIEEDVTAVLGDRHLPNPFTGELTEPRDTVSTELGAIHFRPADVAPRVTEGVVQGFTAENQATGYTTHIDRKEITRENAYLTAIAAEEFANSNGGQYAGNLSQLNGMGQTLISFLPGGTLQSNPYTLAATEPIDGAAATPGQVGYLVVRDPVLPGDNIGAVVTGWGDSEELLTIVLPGPTP